jgi:Nif-specific regulatory protein
MAAPTAAFLVAELDDGFGDVYPLQRGVTYGVGRSPKNRIVLADDLSSRDHAEVAFAEGEWYVRDLGSTNGTKVNGRVVRGDQALEPGDRVQFGSTRFRFVHDLSELPGIPAAPGRPLEDSVRITRRTTKTKFLPGGRGGTVGETVLESGTDRSLAALYRLALDMGSAKTVEALAEAVLAATWTWSPTAVGTASRPPTTRRRSWSAPPSWTAGKPSWPTTCKPIPSSPAATASAS